MAKPPSRRVRETAPPRPASPEYIARVRLIRRTVLHVLLAVCFVGGLAWLVGELRLVVASDRPAGPPAVVFTNRPAWMTDLVAQELARSFRPATVPSVFDRQALVDINRRLKDNPWVSKVRRVRRVYGSSAGDTIEVDCDFRTPTALVYDNEGHYWFVDEKGVKLPEYFEPKHLPQLVYARGKVNLRVIEGVRNPPPRRAGQLWTGDDLQAGIELARTLHGQPFAEEIERINVANYAGRMDLREAHLVLMTKHGTEVRWGRPLNTTDNFVEVKPERKLDAMRRIVARFGRIDAGQPWIDVRFDVVTYPVSPATQAGAHAEMSR